MAILDKVHIPKSLIATFANKIYLLSSILLIVFITLLSVANAFDTPRIQRFDDREKYKVAHTQLSIPFSSPLLSGQKDVEIKSDPQVNLDYKVIGSRIHIYFASPLIHSTKYTLEVANVKDRYGKISKPQKIVFVTEPAKFSFLQKSQNQDSVIMTTVDDKTQEIILALPQIDMYDISEFFIVSAANYPDYALLNVLDRSTGLNSEYRFDNAQIGQLEIRKNQNQLIFTRQSYRIENSLFLPTSGFELYKFDIGHSTEPERVDLEGTQDDDVSQIHISTDGSTMLYRGRDGSYYTLDLNSWQNTSSVGRFLDSGGFDFNTERVALLAMDPNRGFDGYPSIYIHQNTGAGTSVTNANAYSIDPVFGYTTGDIYFAQMYKSENSVDLFEIKKATSDSESMTIWQDPGYSLELPKLSADERYVIVERYKISDLVSNTDMRNYPYRSRPSNAEIGVWDTVNQQMVGEWQSGYDAMWVN